MLGYSASERVPHAASIHCNFVGLWLDRIAVYCVVGVGMLRNVVRFLTRNELVLHHVRKAIASDLEKGVAGAGLLVWILAWKSYSATATKDQVLRAFPGCM